MGVAGNSGQRFSAEGVDALLGTAVGGYELVERLARGGMGVVYRATHRVLGTDVAIKILRPELAADDETRNRFVTEARAAARMRHPNIVQILDLLELPDGRPCIVQELVDGKPLDVIAGSEPMAPERAVRLVSQIAEALQAAHEHGVIHRDVKGPNVLVDENDRAKLLDFGIAKSVQNEATRTLPGFAVGTPHYMAPEQIYGDPIDARTDLYALGVLTYRLVSGRFPFVGSGSEILLKHGRETPRPPEHANSRLAEVILSALEKDRAARPASARLFAHQLHEALEAPSAPDCAVDMVTGIVSFTFATDTARNRFEKDLEANATVVCPGVTSLPRGPLVARLKSPTVIRNRFAERVSEHGADLRIGKMRDELTLRAESPAPSGEDTRPVRKDVDEADTDRVFRRDEPVAATAEERETTRDPSRIDRRLAQLEPLTRLDHYGVLGVAASEHDSMILAAASRLGAELALLLTHANPGQRDRLLALQARIDEARRVLSDAESRFEYDAERGNWRGVARVLGSLTDTAALVHARSRFATAHPERTRRAMVERVAAMSLSRTSPSTALSSIERSLELNPFDLDAHRLQRELFELIAARRR